MLYRYVCINVKKKTSIIRRVHNYIMCIYNVHVISGLIIKYFGEALRIAFIHYNNYYTKRHTLIYMYNVQVYQFNEKVGNLL